MKKTGCSVLIIYLLSLITFFCPAQDYVKPNSPSYTRPYQNNPDSIPKKRFFLSFNFGTSIPLREYAEKTKTNNFMIWGPDSTNGKGFANVGYHGNMSFGAVLSPPPGPVAFGICGKIGFDVNNFDEMTLNQLVNGAYTYSVNGNYTIWQFMGGAFADFQLGRTTSVRIQGMAGLINANFPSFSIYNLPVPPFLPYLSWNFTLPDASDFAYSFSIDFEKGISKRTSIALTVSYTGAELSYPGLTYNFSGPYLGLPPAYTQNTPVTMAYGSLDITIGMLFHL